MTRPDARARELLASIVAPLIEAHGGPASVAKKVGRHRSSVGHWKQGNIDWAGLMQLGSTLRTDIVITFPGHGQPTAQTKEPRPEWAEALATKEDIDAMIETLIPLAVDRAWERLLKERDEPPPVAPVPDTED